MRFPASDGPATEALLLEAVEIVQSDAPLAERRLQLGQRLLRLLRADMFVSYVCGTDGPYSDPVDIHLGRDALRTYDDHFRYVDRLTPALRRRHGVAAVSLPLNSRDEFTRDFLQRRGLHHGMNYFARSPGPGTVDLRVWRERSSGAFRDEDVRALQAVGGLVERLWHVPPAGNLTPRELDVARLVARGLTDRQLCSELGISLPTLRTHLAHAFAKTGVRNRAALAVHYTRHHQH